MSPAFVASKAAAMASSSSNTTTMIRKAYKELAQIIQQMPAKQQKSSMQELRRQFRMPLATSEKDETTRDDLLQARLKEAADRAAFLRITTVKTRPKGEAGRWVYKDGKRLSAQDGTLRDGEGRVVSNWDGKNLDPESVSRHRKQLHRSGFVNNTHAKGLF